MKHPLLFLLLTVILQPVWEFIGGVVGYMLVSILSLGQVRPQGPEDAELKFPWHGFARAPDGRLVVEGTTASLFGALFLLAIIFAVIFWPYLRVA